jgi:hypothetical protein
VGWVVLAGAVIGGLVVGAGGTTRAQEAGPSGTTVVEVPGVPAATAFARTKARRQHRRAAQAAETKASQARARSAELRKSGGWAYKIGAVDRAERDADRHQAAAARDLAAARLPGAALVDELATPAPRPEEVAARERLRKLRQSGGWAYKTGLVAAAEADVKALSEPALEPPLLYGKTEPAPAPTWTKPVESSEKPTVR